MHYEGDQDCTHRTLLKMLMRTMKRVTRSAILPGTTSGLMVNDTHDTTTNIRLGRYTWNQGSSIIDQRVMDRVSCIR